MDRTPSRLARIAATDVGRGSGRLVEHTGGALERAAASLLTAPPTAVILTGYHVTGCGAAETDGPVGAAQLAFAVAALGGSARVVTDAPCAPVVRAAVGDLAPVDVWPCGPYPTASHVIAIERLGPGSDGVARDMRGVAVEAAPLEELFAPGPWLRIGIGDGGNELGMGALPAAAVASAVPDGMRIHCAVACEALIVAGTSNWGAAALVAELARHRPGLLDEALDPAWQERVLAATVAAGAVDGVLRRSQATVDGVTPEDYRAVLAAIRVEA